MAERAKKKTAAVKKAATTRVKSASKTVRKSEVKKTPAAVKAAARPRKASAIAAAMATAIDRIDPSKTAVTNPRLNGMIRENLSHASRARKAVFVDSEMMPDNYGSTSITLLARDPHWVHAYWEVAPAAVGEACARLGLEQGHTAWVLRMYDVTLINFNGQNAHHWFDVEVGPDANNWYVNLWSDHVTYCAEIGVRAPDGRFEALARSNAVTTPREYISARNELVWMEVVQPEGEEPVTAEPYVYASGSWVEDEAEGKEGVAAARRGKGRRFRIYLTEEDIRAYYARLFPLLRRILSRRRRKSTRKTIDTGDADLLLEELEDMDLPGYSYFRKILLGASEEAWLRGRGQRAGQPGGASEELVSSWTTSQAPAKPEGFFFELGTELIVYGRTEPDATVTWHGRPVALRPDGTFTLRMALPTDTHIPLDFKAVSFNQRHQRLITTAANREKTEYAE